MNDPTLTDLLRSQCLIQRHFEVDDPLVQSLAEVGDHVMRNKQYLDDEITEVLTAVGGDVAGKGAWKHWSADRKKALSNSLGMITEEHYQDLLGEVADMFIFALNIAYHTGIMPQDLGPAIAEKQKANVERWKNGYVAAR